MIDTHAHLDYLDYEVVKALKQSGLKFVVNAGTCIETSLNGKKFAEEFDNVYFTVGFHPEYVDIDGKEVEGNIFNNKTLNELEEIAKHKKCVAIGEVGLDFHYLQILLNNGEITEDEFVKNKKEQEGVFVEQIKLAERLKLPLMLHIRDAYEDTERILKENFNLLNNGVIFHCYSGDLEFTKRMLELFKNKTLTYENKNFCDTNFIVEMSSVDSIAEKINTDFSLDGVGKEENITINLSNNYLSEKKLQPNIEKELNYTPSCYFAFGGVITFKKVKDEKAEIIKIIPREQILTETDCPYLTPEPMRGKCENEPKYIKFIYERLATIWGIGFNEVEKQINKNFISAFFKMDV